MGSHCEEKTSVKERTLRPVWHEAFLFVVESLDETVMLEVWDKDRLSGSDYMGEVTSNTCSCNTSILMSAHMSI